MLVIAGNEVDAINWTRLYTKIAAIALCFDDTVHSFCGAENSICGTGLNTFGAADAFVFSNPRHREREWRHVRRIERSGKIADKSSESARSDLAAWWAEVCCGAIEDCLCIGATA